MNAKRMNVTIDLNEYLALDAKAKALQRLSDALRDVLAHERRIVHTLNTYAEPAPAAFSFSCEKARQVLREIEGVRLTPTD